MILAPLGFEADFADAWIQPLGSRVVQPWSAAITLTILKESLTPHMSKYIKFYLTNHWHPSWVPFGPGAAEVRCCLVKFRYWALGPHNGFKSNLKYIQYTQVLLTFQVLPGLRILVIWCNLNTAILCNLLYFCAWVYSAYSIDTRKRHMPIRSDLVFTPFASWQVTRPCSQLQTLQMAW